MSRPRHIRDAQRDREAARAYRHAQFDREDGVRAYCTQVQAAHPAPDPWVVVYDVLRLLDGEGVA